MTFAIVLAGALFAVIPATAPLGLLVCLVASVPAVIALRRTRGVTSTDRTRAVASVALAPTFLVVAIVVVAANATPAPPTGLLAQPGVTTSAAVPSLAPVPSVPTASASTGTALPATSAGQAPAPLSRGRTTTTAARPPVVPPPVTARAAPTCDTSTHYVNVSGNCVPRPGSADTGGAAATATCKDGTPSYSRHRSGTCSGHGGVAQWLVNLP